MPKPYQVQDVYFQKAKKEGYRARSVYKLKEIQNKFHLIKKGDTVIDLGAAPGSFMQAILEWVGLEGKCVGIDLEVMEPLDQRNAILLQGDIFDTESLLPFFKEAGFIPADVVTSDLAPRTSGIRDVDQARSAELTEQAFLLATQCLKPGGHFVGKIFEGEDFPFLVKKMKRHFKTVKTFKPTACRDRSFETYIIGMVFAPKT